MRQHHLPWPTGQWGGKVLISDETSLMPHTQNLPPETWAQNQKSVNSIVFSFQTELNY